MQLGGELFESVHALLEEGQAGEPLLLLVDIEGLAVFAGEGIEVLARELELLRELLGVLGRAVAQV